MGGWLRKQSRSVQKRARKVTGAVAGVVAGGGAAVALDVLGLADGVEDPVNAIAAAIALFVYDQVRNRLKAWVD